jgi:iron complex transport system substrate-binding protein
VKKIILLLVTLIILSSITLLPACTSNSTTTATSTITATTTNTTTLTTTIPNITTATPTTRVITDLTSNVTIPYTIKRVANTWPANNAIMAMLGASNKIVATTPVIKNYAWFEKLFPNIIDLPTPFTSAKEVNLETLFGTQPDVLIYSKGGLDAAILEKITAAKIPAVQLTFDDFVSLKTTVLTTGKVLGPEEEAKAKEFCEYLDKNLKLVTDITSKLADSEKPLVVHTVGNTYLGVDGAKTIIDTWIKLAGGVNAAAPYVEGNGKTISIEQLLLIDPDIIIIGNVESARIKEQLMTDPQCAGLKAVKNGMVYINPIGVFSWDRYSAEEALQILWAAKTLHPDKFESIDMMKEVKNFYSKYFGYNLTDDETTRILNAQTPE